MDLIVLAKEPVPGRVKTRLCPPCSPEQAARLAAAALEDTLVAARRTSADRVVLALDGRVGPWCPPGVEVEAQGPGDLADRLERVWSRRSGPALVIGMDTPQVGDDVLEGAIGTLRRGPRHGAVFGPAVDGGWWLVGVAAPRPGTFTRIPTSRADTGRRQLRRLLGQGCAVRVLPALVDVDTIEAAHEVAASAPESRFAAALGAVLEGAAP